MKFLIETLTETKQRLSRLLPAVRANRVAPVISNRFDEALGVGQSWMPLSYGEYYPRSVLVYSAIKVRQDAMAQVRPVVMRADDDGARARGRGVVMHDGGGHRELSLTRGARPDMQIIQSKLQRLLDSPNPFWTRGDLWRATETYLGLWGSAFWGWWSRVAPAVETADAVADTTTTSVAVSSRASVEAGHALLIDTEQMYVQSYSSNTLTVVRGVNGTTAASHAGSTAIDIYQYPGAIAEATIIQAARLWRRRDGAYSGNGGPAGAIAGLDEDVRLMLGQFRRHALEVGV